MDHGVSSQWLEPPIDPPLFVQPPHESRAQKLNSLLLSLPRLFLSERTPLSASHQSASSLSFLNFGIFNWFCWHFESSLTVKLLPGNGNKPQPNPDRQGGDCSKPELS